MRPPEFTGGNTERLTPVSDRSLPWRIRASMRPPEFTGGNLAHEAAVTARERTSCFNEAAGIHRRKRERAQPSAGIPWRLTSHRFNEAAGIHRRKPGSVPAGAPAVSK